MTVTDQINILNRKIKQNKSQYDLDWKAAEISALSSKSLDKYELLTGEDLDLKPSTVAQAKFEYSPLGKIFNKGLSEDDKKEGLFKRLENIKDTNLTQLQAIKDRGEKQLKELKNIDKNKTLKAIDEISKRNAESNRTLLDIKKIDTKLDTAELVCTKTDGTKYNFNIFALPLKFIEKVHNYEITLDEAINNQKDLDILINKLNNDYVPRNAEKVEEKKRVLESARKFQNTRKDIIDLFEKGILPYRGNVFKTKEESKENKFFYYIENESKGINYDLFRKYFSFETPTQLTKKLFEIKDKKKNNDFVEEIKNRWSKLNDGIEEMSEDKKNWKAR